MAYRTSIPKRFLITFGVTSAEFNAKNKKEALKKAYIEQKKLTKIEEIKHGI